MSDITPHSKPAPDLRPVGARVSFVTLRTISALILRQMSSTYGRSAGGYVWAILEPAAGIVFLTVIFSSGFRTPPLGTNFAIYYAAGFLPFFMFQKVMMTAAGTLRTTKSLLAFPRVTIVDALLARIALEVMTQLLISFLIFGYILFLYDTRTILNLPDLLLAYAMAISFGTGIGVLNCFLSTRFEVWKTFFSILTRPLVLISGVIFLHDRVPMPYREWMEWNPLVHVVGQARRAFYISYRAEYVDVIFVFTVSAICGAMGAIFLRRYYRDTIESHA